MTKMKIQTTDRNSSVQRGTTAMKTRSALKVGLALAMTMTLANCGYVGPTGQSKTLAKYSDAQIERCGKSLTPREHDEAMRNAKARIMAKSFIPIVGGLLIDGTDEFYAEAEKICRRKGIL